MARAVNKALGTTIGPWDVRQMDDALLGAILCLLRPAAPRSIPIAPAIEARKREIRNSYWKRFGMRPPVM